MHRTSVFSSCALLGALMACAPDVSAAQPGSAPTSTTTEDPPFATPAWDAAHSWAGTLPLLRTARFPVYALYIGRERSLMWQRVRRGEVHANGAWIFRLSAADTVINPYTGRQVLGVQQIGNLLGPIGDLSGGSFTFFDQEFIALPRFTVIQNFHRNRPEVISFYLAMLTDPLRDRLTMAEFARYKAQPIGLQLVMEAESGRHKDFSHYFRELPDSEPLFRGVDAEGTVVDPRTDPSIHIVTSDPDGEVFVAQVREIWEKLAIGTGEERQRPPLTIFGPAKARYPGLDALGIRYRAVSLTQQQLEGRPSPRIILPSQSVPTGEKGRGAVEITGFVPGQVIGEYVLSKAAAGLLNDNRLLHPDIPFGDLDVEGRPAPAGAAPAAAATASATTEVRP